jgi:hypothetical protein
MNTPWNLFAVDAPVAKFTDDNYTRVTQDRFGKN